MPSFSLLACCLWATALAAPPTVEVVLSHFHEDVSWVNRYSGSQAVFTMYSKAVTPPENAIPLPNIGRESHTYLHHIVRNYDKLADWTVFSQAVEPSWGYNGGGPVSGHLTDTVTFDDYLEPMPAGRDSFFPLSAVSQFPSGKQLNRMGFMTQDMDPEMLSKGECPVGDSNGWTPWWWDKDHPQLRQLSSSDPTMLEFYHRYIAQDAYTDRPLTLAFVQGARFAVSKARVHRRPREYYIDLLAQLSGSAGPIQGYWMEAAWFDVFHPEALQSSGPACALPSEPTANPLSIPEMEEAVKQRARSQMLTSEWRETVRALSSAYTDAPTPAPTPPPTPEPTQAPDGERNVVVVKGMIELGDVAHATTFVDDYYVKDAMEGNIANITGASKGDVEVTLTIKSRRLESVMGVRRLQVQAVEAAYKVRVNVNQLGNPVNTNFNSATAARAMRDMDKGTFASNVVAQIQASSSPLANTIQSFTVATVTGETQSVESLVSDNARKQAALALAYLVAALAALVPVLTWWPLQ